MQIQLNQTEIHTALKDYVTKLGINLQGRTVEIVFTSGRKENGIIVDLCISDDADDFPVFTSEEVQTSTDGTVVGSIAPAQGTESDAAKTSGVLDPSDTPPTKPTSLFGS
jgi:hypothetical protein